MKVLLAAHTHIGGPFTVGSHHLARELNALGHEVAHFSTSVTPFHLARLRDASVRQRFRLAFRRPRPADQLLNGVPLRLIPDRRRNSSATAPSRLQRWWLRHLRLETFDLVLIDQPALSWMLAHTSNACVLYRPTDVYTDLTGSDDVTSFESVVLDTAVGAIATSTVVLDHLRSMSVREIPMLLVENGVEHAHFATAIALPTPTDDSVVYVGALDERFDWVGVADAARARPLLRFDLYGPVDRRPDLPPNVVLHGALDYSRLPGALATARVGLLPLSDHPGNRGRSPMKFYEYQAAGLPVVARSTPELARRTDSALILYDDAPAMGRAIDEALRWPRERAAISQAAAAFDWSAKTTQILEFATSCCRKNAVAR